MDSVELIESFAEFANQKQIDRPTVMKILDEVFRTLIRKKYESDENFDVIIMNRGISYLTQPLTIVRRLMEKLTSSGLLLITGLNVYSNPISRQKTLADRAARYRRLYGVELFPFPTRGYLDQDDLSGLKQLGISLDACRYGLSNLRSFFRPSRPRCYRGWYQKS